MQKQAKSNNLFLLSWNYTYTFLLILFIDLLLIPVVDAWFGNDFTPDAPPDATVPIYLGS